MASSPEPPEGTNRLPPRVRVHLGTAANVGTLFGLDWCVIVGAKDGDVRFIPWQKSPADEGVLRRWLEHLAAFRSDPSPFRGT